MRIFRARQVLLFVFFTVACGACTDHQAAPDTADELTTELQTRLEAALQDFNAPGGALAIARAGSSTQLLTAGSIDEAGEQPMHHEVDWPLRSITKSFVVTLLLQLADEGFLELDAPIAHYVDDIPHGDRITLRMLAGMTAGNPDYTTEAFIADFLEDPTAPFTTERLLDYVRSEAPLFEPDTARVYVNANTVLLGVALSEAAQTPLATLLHDRLFQPLELTSTHYVQDVLGAGLDLPIGYQPSDDGELAEQPVNFTVFDAAGAMVSSLTDLLRWGEALGAGWSLSEAAVEARTATAGPLEGPEYDEYGLGLGRLETFWGHTGEGFGISTLVMHDAQRQLTVAICMNIANIEAHAPTALFRELTKVLD